MRQIVVTIALVIAASSLDNAARAQDGTCEAIFKAYEYGSKLQSRYSALAITGALTASRADALANNAMILRQLNLTLLIENKCPAPTAPALIDEYRGAAVECALAIQNKVGSPSVCNMEDWKKGN